MLKNKALIKLGALLLLAAAIRTKLCVYRVTGSSMAPSLHDGDLVICMRSHRPGKGSIALLHRGSSLMIKTCDSYRRRASAYRWHRQGLCGFCPFERTISARKAHT